MIKKDKILQTSQSL